MDYALLGKREIPILSVLAVSGRTDRPKEDIVRGALDIAKNHLLGKEWCENACGLAAYPALIRHLESEDAQMACSWNMEYFLGTYAPLKWYAWKFLERHGLEELAALYRAVYENWQKAFESRKSLDLSKEKNRQEIAQLLRQAEAYERQAVDRM